MNAQATTFTNLLATHRNHEGMVFLGCGGDVQEWIDGISTTLHEQGMSTVARADMMWAEVFLLTTTGGRVDLIFVFKDNNPLNIGKLAMWRLRFGDCSWWSDYIVNYAKHHGVTVAEDETDETTVEDE